MPVRYAALLLVSFAAPAFAQSPLPPVVAVPGPLVIVGGGGMPEAVRKSFIALAGGETAKLLVVPTASAAAGDPAQVESFLEGWTKLGVKDVAIFHAKSKDEANDPAFVKRLESATGVWFSGGDQ
jgi:cyanophycinase